MEEWKEYKLGDLIVLSSGGTPNTSNSSYWGGDIPWISAKAMYADYLYSSDMTITREGLSNGSKLAPINSILLLTRGSGLFNRIPVCLVKREMAFNQDLKCIESINNNTVSNLFLFYWLMGNKQELSNILETTGIGAGKIDTERLKSIHIKIPPIQIQQVLIEFAESLMLKIEVNKRINDNLEKQAQALFKSWFVDFNPFKDGEFVESEVGMIPKGWRAGTLSEIANITMGTSPSGASYNVNGEGEVFYQGRAEFGYRFPHRNMYTTEPKRYAEDGDVLLSVRAPVGDVNIANERCCIGRGLAAIGSESCPSYILYLVKSLKSVFEQYNGEGTVFGSINKKTLEGLRIIVPESKYIERFEKVANPLDGQIRCKEEESRRLASLRDTLLPKLMSGELKLNEVNV